MRDGTQRCGTGAGVTADERVRDAWWRRGLVCRRVESRDGVGVCVWVRQRTASGMVGKGVRVT